jgi:hypothetical protein
MRTLMLIFGMVSTQMSGAVVLDRIAAIVGKNAIKTSDIERDLRVTAFLNKAVLNRSEASQRKAAERLIDQSLIRDEITTGDYDRATDADAQKMLEQLRRDRFAGADTRMRQELTKYGLSEDELKDQLLWQLTVLRFIQQRFNPAVLVPDQDVKAYYDGHLAELKRQYPKDSSFATLQPRIENLLQTQAADKEFNAWLDEKRKAAEIEYRQGAFQGALP